jgi:hypothetical protein
VHFANFTRAGVAFSMRGPDGWDIKCDSDGTFVDCV